MVEALVKNKPGPNLWISEVGEPVIDKITDLNSWRLKLAARMGAIHTVDVRVRSIAEIRPELGISEGFDVGLQMSGYPAGLSRAAKSCSILFDRVIALVRRNEDKRHG